MKSESLVTIIIPVYNVSDYIDDCLKSVTRQSYNNIEVVLVNDGSTDDSGQKCDRWAREDTRIKVVHKKNEGLNYARRDGFKKASGEYVTFLDSDDLFHLDNVKISLQEAKNSHADIVTYTFTKFSDNAATDKLIADPVAKYETTHYSSKQDILECIFLEKGIYPSSHAITAWGKLYKRELVDGVDWRVSNYRSYEDNFWTPQLFAVAKKVTMLSCPLSSYRRNDEYGAQGNTLGNRLVGNTYNNKPVGYIELIDRAFAYYKKIAESHRVNIGAELYGMRYLHMKARFDNLIRAGLVREENNLQYLGEVWGELSRRHDGLEDQNLVLRNEINTLSLESEELRDRMYEITKSHSWRLTGPLRTVMGALKKRESNIKTNRRS